MKATLRLEDGREIKVEISENDVENLTKSDKKTGWERVEANCEYFLYADGQIETDVENYRSYDKRLYELGNYFSNEQIANDQARAISLWLRIKRWAAEHCEPVDWNNRRTSKYCIFYNYVTNKFDVGFSSWTPLVFCIYFDTKDHAEQCIEEFRDELTWYFTECKDRMDG